MIRFRALLPMLSAISLLAACGDEEDAPPAPQAAPSSAPISQSPPAPPPSGSTTYYMAPRAAISGVSAACDDANSGASPQAPWCTPNHPMRPGDRLIAVPSAAYEPFDQWGTVSYTDGQDLAWLVCQQPFACAINSSTDLQAMRMTASGWGVSGWVISAPNGACVAVIPPAPGAWVHHIAIVNNVLGPCGSNGVSTSPHHANGSGPGGVDYLFFAANLVRDAARSSAHCHTGISVYEPRNWDTNAGTRIMISRNVSWANVDACPGNTDGNGIIIDDLDGGQKGYPSPYTGGVLVENNLIMQNGAAGIIAFASTSAPTVIRRNTVYGGYLDPAHTSDGGMIFLNQVKRTRAERNIAAALASSGANGRPVSGLLSFGGDSTNAFVDNIVWMAAGGAPIRSSFPVGANVTNVNPSLTAPTVPTALPDCSGKASTLDCTAGLWAAFAPRAPEAQGRGAAPLSETRRADDLVPSWICALTLPVSGVLDC